MNEWRIEGAGDCPVEPLADVTGPILRELAIINKRGLHARASAKFVALAEKFDAEIRVSRAGDTVGGTSIMGLMMLAAAQGTTITVQAIGREAAQAIEAIERLVADRFGEEE
jgi:phosphocarrier protein